MVLTFLLFVFFIWSATIYAGEKISVVEIRGIINPVQVSYFQRALQQSISKKTSYLILRIDTPGGLDESMRELVQSILHSPIPIIAYVSPAGARAASAGSFLVMACHRAFMSPGTTIGAAHPVTISGQQVSEKIVNDAAAYIKTLAELHHRNTIVAEQMVRESLSLTENEALQKGMIDGVAPEMNDIYRSLGIEEPEVIPIPMVGKENFLHTILNPNIAYILLIIGTLGIIMELANPGSIAPGVFGGISLVLAFFAFSVFTINFTGIFLILLGIFLILLDVWVTPGIGVLTAGGSISLFFGSLLLYNIESGIHLNIEMILIALFILIGFSIFLLTMVVKTMKKKKTMGVESIIGKNGWVQKDINPEGFVVIDGELWSARSDTPILKGEEVIILKKVEHYLIVTRKGGQEK